MKKAIFYFRNGGIIITQVADVHDGGNVGRCLRSGGFIVGRDSFWGGEQREVSINLGDVTRVIIIASPVGRQD